MQKLESTLGTAIEVVLYKVKSGISAEQAQQAAIAVNNFIAQQPGFLRRVLSRNSDGGWLDIVEWNSLPEALQAAERAMEHPATAEFFSIIDQETLQVHHAETVFVH